MAAWYAGQKMPAGPLRLNNYSTIIDVQRYADANVAIITAYKENPLAAPFMPAYMRLYELKKYIENEQPGTTNGQP